MISTVRTKQFMYAHVRYSTGIDVQMLWLMLLIYSTVPCTQGFCFWTSCSYNGVDTRPLGRSWGSLATPMTSHSRTTTHSQCEQPIMALTIIPYCYNVLRANFTSANNVFTKIRRQRPIMVLYDITILARLQKLHRKLSTFLLIWLICKGFIACKTL